MRDLWRKIGISLRGIKRRDFNLKPVTKTFVHNCLEACLAVFDPICDTNLEPRKSRVVDVSLIFIAAVIQNAK